MVHGIGTCTGLPAPARVMEGQAAAVAEEIHDAVAALPPSDPSRRPPLRLRRRPSTASTSSAKNATVFRANVLTLLAKLPSAAAPTGFASLRFAGVVTCGLCFGYATPSQCRECLAAAAKKLADGCGARGAGVWMDVCFASYADADTSSPSSDGFGARVISGADALATSSSPELQSRAGRGHQQIYSAKYQRRFEDRRRRRLAARINGGEWK